MRYKFNKEKFQRNAPANIKTRLKYLLDDLENLEVDFTKDNIHGTVSVNLHGVEHELYPVYKEWCTIEEQLKLIL